MNRCDVRIVDVQLLFLPLTMRVPLKFGSEISTGYDTAKVRMTVEQISTGKQASGYGESPLSPAWAWPGKQPFSERLEKMRCFCRSLQLQWQKFQDTGHALEIGHHFLQTDWQQDFPELAALTCNAAFDLALHDAYGILHDRPIYQTYNRIFLNRDLEYFFGIMHSKTCIRKIF